MASAAGSVATAFDHVEAEVRELVRRRGLDPVQDRSAMRRLIDEVVVDYDERALTSTLPPLPDPRSAARAVYDAVAGFGPLQRHLDDPTVEEIWINDRLTQGSALRNATRSVRWARWTRLLLVPAAEAGRAELTRQLATLAVVGQQPPSPVSGRQPASAAPRSSASTAAPNSDPKRIAGMSTTDPGRGGCLRTRARVRAAGAASGLRAPAAQLRRRAP